MEILIKKQKYLHLLHSILLMIVFGVATSCRKQDSTVKLPKVDPKLVVVSFISPQDTLIRVWVKTSQPLYNNAASKTYETITDAEVIISGNGISAKLAYDAALKEYTCDPSLLNVSEGVDYVINVSTPDGKKATASTQIPSANSSLTYTYTNASANIYAQWTDLSQGTADYYRLMIEQTSYFIFSGYNSGATFEDTITTRGIQYQGFFLDTDFSGSTLNRNVPFQIYEDSEDKIYLHLLHVSKEYYDYSEKLVTSEVYGNPFQEPSIMYTNVTGGFGVFAGYNGYRVEVIP